MRCVSLQNAAGLARPHGLRQLWATSGHKLAHRGQSTLVAHPAEALAHEAFGSVLQPPTRAAPTKSGASWAAEAERWLAHRRAAEFAADTLTAKQITQLAPIAHCWKAEFAAWTDTAPGAPAQLASTSYACVAGAMGTAKSAKLTNTWADETEVWLAQRRAKEHASDRLMVQEMQWFK